MSIIDKIKGIFNNEETENVDAITGAGAISGIPTMPTIPIEQPEQEQQPVQPEKEWQNPFTKKVVTDKEDTEAVQGLQSGLSGRDEVSDNLLIGATKLFEEGRALFKTFKEGQSAKKEGELATAGFLMDLGVDKKKLNTFFGVQKMFDEGTDTYTPSRLNKKINTVQTLLADKSDFEDIYYYKKDVINLGYNIDMAKAKTKDEAIAVHNYYSGLASELSAKAEEKDNEVSLALQDEGINLPVEEVKKKFDEFANVQQKKGEESQKRVEDIYAGLDKKLVEMGYEPTKKIEAEKKAVSRAEEIGARNQEGYAAVTNDIVYNQGIDSFEGLNTFVLSSCAMQIYEAMQNRVESMVREYNNAANELSIGLKKGQLTDVDYKYYMDKMKKRDQYIDKAGDALHKFGQLDYNGLSKKLSADEAFIAADAEYKRLYGEGLMKNIQDMAIGDRKQTFAMTELDHLKLGLDEIKRQALLDKGIAPIESFKYATSLLSNGFTYLNSVIRGSVVGMTPRSQYGNVQASVMDLNRIKNTDLSREGVAWHKRLGNTMADIGDNIGTAVVTLLLTRGLGTLGELSQIPVMTSGIGSYATRRALSVVPQILMEWGPVNWLISGALGSSNVGYQDMDAQFDLYGGLFAELLIGARSLLKATKGMGDISIFNMLQNDDFLKQVLERRGGQKVSQKDINEIKKIIGEASSFSNQLFLKDPGLYEQRLKQSIAQAETMNIFKNNFINSLSSIGTFGKKPSGVVDVIGQIQNGTFKLGATPADPKLADLYNRVLKVQSSAAITTPAEKIQILVDDISQYLNEGDINYLNKLYVDTQKDAIPVFISKTFPLRDPKTKVLLGIGDSTVKKEGMDELRSYFIDLGNRLTEGDRVSYSDIIKIGNEEKKISLFENNISMPILERLEKGDRFINDLKDFNVKQFKDNTKAYIKSIKEMVNVKGGFLGKIELNDIGRTFFKEYGDTAVDVQKSAEEVVDTAAKKNTIIVSRTNKLDMDDVTERTYAALEEAFPGNATVNQMKNANVQQNVIDCMDSILDDIAC